MSSKFKNIIFNRRSVTKRVPELVESNRTTTVKGTKTSKFKNRAFGRRGMFQQIIIHVYVRRNLVSNEFNSQ
jgi:hypothetical protein